MPVVRSAIAAAITPGIVARRRPSLAAARARFGSGRLDPRRFGRAAFVRTDAPAPEPRVSTFAADFKLFAMTFLAGFLFVSILLA